MRTPELDPARQCGDKKRLRSRKIAKAYIKQVRGTGKTSGKAKDLRPYLCQHCNNWHFGHKPKGGGL